MAFDYSLGSDLHIDHPHPTRPSFLKNVILAGDTSNGLLGTRYLQKLIRKGHNVFAVDGNHEHYSNASKNRTIDETERQFYALLGQERVLRVSSRFVIIGCNGWYVVQNPQLWYNYMNDGRFAGSENEVNEKAEEHAHWLRYQLKKIGEKQKAIVVTHTAPCMATLDQRYKGHYSNEWYWNPYMEELMIEFADRIAVWHHGHTHNATSAVVHGVQVVTNPRGYPGENPGWKPASVELVAYDEHRFPHGYIGTRVSNHPSRGYTKEVGTVAGPV